MKKRITIYLDEDVLDAFRSRAEESGAGYQTMINDTLKKSIERGLEHPERKSLMEVLLEIPTGDETDLFAREDDFPADDVFG
ncbi:MAG: BrnA antitoxin family protein [Gammaproteobacteria bacterium]